MVKKSNLHQSVVVYSLLSLVVAFLMAALWLA
jgi:hypothetical protein